VKVHHAFGFRLSRISAGSLMCLWHILLRLLPIFEETPLRLNLCLHNREELFCNACKLSSPCCCCCCCFSESFCRFFAELAEPLLDNTEFFEGFLASLLGVMVGKIEGEAASGFHNRGNNLHCIQLGLRWRQQFQRKQSC